MLDKELDSSEDLIEEEFQKEFEELSSKTGTEGCLMDEVLMHQPHDVQRDVRKLIEISGIQQDDPIFLVLLCCRVTQILLQKAPKELEKSFDNGRRILMGVLEEYSEKIINGQKQYLEDSKKDLLAISSARLDNAIAKVLENNGVEVKKGGLTPRVKGVIATAITTGIALVLGTGVGLSIEKAALAKTNTYTLSAKEKVDLDWVQSEEGKFAKKLLEWNDDVIGQECQQKVKDLGITFQVGSAKAVSGFCVLFTESVSKRQFVQLQE